VVRRNARIVAAEDQLNFSQSNLDYFFFQQGLIENFQAGFDLKILSVIGIAIENGSRGDQGLIERDWIHPMVIYDDALGQHPTLIHSQL
jgi:hypothetical protein